MIFWNGVKIKMSNKVKTYLNPNEWNKYHQDDVHVMSSCINVCATGSVQRGIKNTYGLNVVKSYVQIKNDLFSFWFGEEKRLRVLLEVALEIDNGKSFLKVDEHSFISKNYKEMIETVFQLRFLGINTSYFKNIDLNGKEKNLITFWNLCMSKSDTFKAMCRKLEFYKTNPKLIVEKLYENAEKGLDKTTIYVHGFYYITPEQQIIIKLLEQADINIVFFNLYDNRFKHTFDFIRKFLCGEFDWTDDWEIESQIGYSESKLGGSFLDIFEGHERDFKKLIALYRYSDFNVFLQQVIIPIEEKNDKESIIVSTSADILNKIILNYFPDKYAITRNFLKYPIGIYLTNLYKMYSEEGLRLDFTTLVNLFSSGFVYDGKKNARDYVGQLYDLQSYFQDCMTMEDWDTRFDELYNLYDEVLSEFQQDSSRIGKASRHPFTRISYATLDYNDIKVIKTFIYKIYNLYFRLFADQRMSTFNMHFRTMREMLNGIINDSELAELEKDVVIALLEKVEKVQGDTKFMYKDIADAMSLYLSGRFEESENIVIPFIEVDGLAFGKNFKKCFLTGMDEGGLPLSRFEMPYPLCEDTIRDLSKMKKELKMLIYRNDSIKEISRYLLYNVFEFYDLQNVEFSWISNFADKEKLDPSIYMDVVGFQREDKPLIYRKPEFKDYMYDSEKFESLIQYDIFIDYIAEFNYCQKRFFYSYLLSNHSYFREGFNQKFIFGEIVRLVRSKVATDEEAIILVSRIFPQWNEVAKAISGQQSAKFAVSRNHDLVKEMRLSTKRYRYIFPGIKSDKCNLIYQKNEKVDKLISDALIASRFIKSNTEECYFCPNNWHCPNIYDVLMEVQDE